MNEASAPAPSEYGSPSRVTVTFYLATIALLPWSWFPPFPWLHEHAQWSDVTFSIAALSWIVERWRAREWRGFGAAHVAIGLYLAAAILSSIFSPVDKAEGALKVAGIAELCMLAVVTSDLASCPRVLRLIVQVAALSSLIVGAAAICGLGLMYMGIRTPLIGIYGELTPSPLYARVQGGLYNPNLLASYTIFAAALVARRDVKINARLRTASLIALWMTSALTFSRGFLGFILAAVIRNARTGKGRIAAAATAVVLIVAMVSMTIWRVSLNPLSPHKARIGDALTVRYQAAISSSETLARNPLWGTGPASHPGNIAGNLLDSHMTFINIAATLGLPALIAFISILVIAWRRRRLPTNLAVWGGLAGLGLDALAQDVEDFRHVWVMIGIALADAGMRAAASEKEPESKNALRLRKDNLFR